MHVEPSIRIIVTLGLGLLAAGAARHHKRTARRNADRRANNARQLAAIAAELGRMNLDHREDDQHRIAVLTQIKRHGQTLDVLAERVEARTAAGYMGAFLAGVEDRNFGPEN